MMNDVTIFTLLKMEEWSPCRQVSDFLNQGPN